MNPAIVSAFGEIKHYLQSLTAPGPIDLYILRANGTMTVKWVCDHGYWQEVIDCFDTVKYKLTLDQYYDLKQYFRYLEDIHVYQFNYEFFRKD